MKRLTPGLRKFMLTAHVTFSVGWLGAVVAFLAMAITGLMGGHPLTVQSVYLAMELTAWYVILPLCIASLVTGLIQSLGTEWGLFRHYWVLFKFLITLVATLIFLIHLQPVTRLASAAALSSLSATDLRPVRIQITVDAALALVALLVATTLSVYKPKGMTRYGRRKQKARL